MDTNSDTQTQPTPLCSRDSELQKLFRSGITSSNRPSIIQFLIDAEADLKAYQNEIFKLKAAMVSLENKRNGLKKKIAKYRTLLSPIHRMPNEILEIVFAFACEENWMRKLCRAPALILSKTCGRWREIALSTPSLWSSICIDFGDWNRDYQILNGLTRLFLDRSRASSLKIILDFNDEDIKGYAVLIMKAMVRHSNRWKDLELRRIQQGVIGHAVFHPLRGSLTVLSHLTITGTPLETSPDFSCDLFGVCPSLTSLALEPGFTLTTHCPLPWSQIRSLRLQMCYGGDGLQSFALARNVQRLEIDQFGGGSPYLGDYIISTVQKLIVVVLRSNEFSCIMESTTLSQLSSLQVSGCKTSPLSTWQQWDQKCITDFLHRSSCTLTSLSLKWVPITDIQTIDLLQKVPTLTRLHIEEYRSGESRNKIVTRKLLDEISFDHENATTSTRFLPKLTDITLIAHASGLDHEALSRAISSRWIQDSIYEGEAGIGCITKVNIVLLARKSEDREEEVGKALESDLRWMEAAGARLIVSTRFI
ncbi:hypothetical protein Moror_10618 [Moniliophthora roreri MCA 2997]|uniref:Uncharacterized protein n=2 Tax=Moniliophthora roreri TaxID=221103 RepID=V2YJB6_MONRO|nr:hypothetical protein Moror_10618 [Moniliophthora roreri MCA 2997]KAI3603989.1 hypothetical protein WG66_000816 [Moniliophthora roreri]